jgi:hypothetical protein
MLRHAIALKIIAMFAIMARVVSKRTTTCLTFAPYKSVFCQLDQSDQQLRSNHDTAAVVAQ